jgi:tRNA A37 N6-isopentenylltransferase MiaA
MLCLLFHHWVPAILSRIGQELRQCQRADAAGGILDRSKSDLYARLRARFDSPSAQALTREARTWFSDGAPHCTRCEWDQEIVNIGSPEIPYYFAADAACFDRRSLRILSGW